MSQDKKPITAREVFKQATEKAVASVTKQKGPIMDKQKQNNFGKKIK